MNKIYIIPILFLFIFSACFKEESLDVKGKKPIYINKTAFTTVESVSAKSFSKVGKIFKLGNRIYITDIGTGVHVINNAIPSNPTKEAFISIYGNSDVAVKNNTMYADNASNLLAIDISDLNNVSISKTIENVYENSGQKYPKNFSGYFECVDADKGFVIDWVDSDLHNPQCQF